MVIRKHKLWQVQPSLYGLWIWSYLLAESRQGLFGVLYIILQIAGKVVYNTEKPSGIHGYTCF